MTMHSVVRRLGGSLRLGGVLTLVFLFIALPFGGPSTVQAQDVPPGVPATQQYGRPGVPKITVFVWGRAKTGVWAVEEGTDLVEFLTVASQSGFDDRSPDRKQINRFKLFRKGQRSGEPFYEERLEVLFSRTVSYPEMQPGDILVIETQTRRRLSWRDITTVTGTIIGIVNTYLLLDRLNRD